MNHRDTETQRKSHEKLPLHFSLCLCVSVVKAFQERINGDDHVRHD